MNRKDAERVDAEHLAFELERRRDSTVPETLREEIAALSDAELRLRIVRSKIAAPRGAHRTPAQRASLDLLRARGNYSSWMSDDKLVAELERAWGVVVADDGLLECERINERLTWVGDLPFALYHHTSTALISAIRADGLKVGQQTNFCNTQAGVYVSTIRAGRPVEIYSRRASKVHGGDPATLRLARRLADLTPDPDDADLAWAQGRQFVTPFVPPEDLRWDDLSCEPAETAFELPRATA